PSKRVAPRITTSERGGLSPPSFGSSAGATAGSRANRKAEPRGSRMRFFRAEPPVKEYPAIIADLRREARGDLTPRPVGVTSIGRIDPSARFPVDWSGKVFF